MNFQRRNLVVTLGAVLTGFFSTRAIAQSTKQQNSTMQQTSDRAEIIDAVNIIAIGADLRDWQACRAAFADSVLTDYTSLNGGTPNTVAADDLIAGWTDFFNKTFKATHHMIANHTVTVDGDRARCTSLFQAHHVYLAGAKGTTWTLGGFYHHGLKRIDGRWKVTEMKMTWTWEEGTRPS
jgi:ketosteroid isomerase-like protein